MSQTPLNLLTLGALPPEATVALESAAEGRFIVHEHADRDSLSAQLHQNGADVLLIDADGFDGAQQFVEYSAVDTATLIVTADPSLDGLLAWLQRGAQDVLTPAELAAASLPRRLRAAIERKRLEREARTAYATDLETGLPHQQQLIEHMSQLLALREREPAPMAVLALRIEGLATAEARLGRELANVLRRKVGVRLRAGVRASDVVASLGDDSFAVLLGSLLAPADAERVGAKLLAALRDPLKVGGDDLTVAAALGIAHYPQDGDQPDALLRRAVGLAAGAAAQGRSGFSNHIEAGGQIRGAANDD